MHSANATDAPQVQGARLLFQHRQAPNSFRNLCAQVEDGWGQGEGRLMIHI